MGKPETELLDTKRYDKLGMIKQLHQFCDINSGTTNLSGLVQMRHALHAAFSPVADDIQTITLPEITQITMNGNRALQACGDALYIRKRPELKRRVLLSGHMDTVYDINHPFQTLTYLNDNQLNGPGVADMKGGLVVMLHALLAFESTPQASALGWDILINADEETGSLASRSLIKDIAPQYQAALVYEPAMTTHGMFAKNRKGSGKLTLVSTGRAAHAGRAFDDGRNAICYLAEIITAVHELNGKREGVTINVGKMWGGEALNVVPEKAVAKLDIRISQPEDEAWVREQLDWLLERMKRPDYHIDLSGSFDRPVKRINEKTVSLFSRIQHMGRQLGLSLDWADSGGCCDGNNLAQHGLPVLDTLGVRGGDIHSPNEFILLDSLVERAALSAMVLHDLAQGGLERLS